MTRAELIAALERLARQTDDRFRAEAILAGAFQAEYNELRDRRPSTDAAHRRLLELDPYVNGCRQAADRLLEEADVLRHAIVALGDTP